MRIIHTADLHLYSSFGTYKDKEKAKIRKNETDSCLERIIEYAGNNQVKAILISGDMFDKEIVSSKDMAKVCHLIRSNRNIEFFFVPGNHDMNISLPEMPNFHIFGNKPVFYSIGNIRIAGMAINDNTLKTDYYDISFDEDSINILMLHGNIIPGEIRGAEDIPVELLKYKNIDYLALGHIHAFREGNLDKRCIYCYPGCPSGRGFDETGDKGFVLLDIDEEKREISRSFIKDNTRIIEDIKMDISSCDDIYEAMDLIKNELSNRELKDNIIKVRLVGNRSEELLVDTDFMEERLSKDCFYIKIVDETRIWIDDESYKDDESLKGEFIRNVASRESDEDMRNEIIRYGLKALRGEDLFID